MEITQEILSIGSTIQAQRDHRQRGCIRVDQIARRPTGMELGFEGVQTFEVVELVNMLVDIVQGAFDVSIFGLFTHAREGT